jgi:hypothetical protein
LCSEACRQEAAAEVLAAMEARAQWIREQLAGLDPIAAHQRLQQILAEEEAEELAAGVRRLTVVHGYLELDHEQALYGRLLRAIEDQCAGRGWSRTDRSDHFPLSVGRPDTDLLVTRLADLACELASASGARRGYRWQVCLLKYPRERWP